MIAFTSPYLWYTTRATGLVALVLFTLVVCLGTFVSNRVGGTNVGRFELNELHRSISMVAMAFLVVHILTTIVDSYVPTGWLSAVVPMTSHYERLDVALGAVAFDLILAVWVSSLMKSRIAERVVALHPLVQLAGLRGRRDRARFLDRHRRPFRHRSRRRAPPAPSRSSPPRSGVT